MPLRHLPDPPNLEQLKKQAKDLLKAFRSGDPDASQEFAEKHPRPKSSDDVKLTDAQLVISQSYGFDSWPKLRKQVTGTQLRHAIWNRDPDTVRQAITEEPETLHESGKHPRWGGHPTPIQIAAERGEADIVRILLDEGADPENGTEGYGWTALQLAAHWGHQEVTELLIGCGARIDIFSAALLGDSEMVSMLLAGDPDIATTPGLNASPPLHFVSTPEVAELLMDQGATLTTVDSYGNTPLAAAIGRGTRCFPVAELLIEKGATADPCVLAALGKTEELLATIASDHEAVHFKGQIGQMSVTGTPLHAAVQHNQGETAAMLLENGANPNAKANVGQSPLHLCSLPEIANLLVESGASVNATDDDHQTTPLIWAKIGIEVHGDSPSRRELVDYLSSIADEGA